MQTFFKKFFDLQFFGGEGAGAGAGAGGDGAGDGASATGVSSGDAGQTTINTDNSRTLESLGVPKDKADKYRASKAKRAAAQQAAVGSTDESTPPPANQTTAPAAETAVSTDIPEQRDFDQEFKAFLEQPEFNQRMQNIVSNRTSKMRGLIDALAPALEKLGEKYNVDASDLSKLDAKALSDAILDDPSFYEKLAADMGADVETAKRIDQREKESARIQKQAQDLLLQQAFDNHMAKLRQQAQAVKAKYPNFDLDRELQDKRFSNMTSPGGGLDVESAYYALHHAEIEQARVNEAANRTAQAIANSIQSGRNVPVQNGVSGRSAATVSNKLYSQMTPAERAAAKQRLKTTGTY